MSEQEKQDQAEKPVKLVHYTTAEAAYSILSKGELWMRPVSLLNDTSELSYGHNYFEEEIKYLVEQEIGQPLSKADKRLLTPEGKKELLLQYLMEKIKNRQGFTPKEREEILEVFDESNKNENPFGDAYYESYIASFATIETNDSNLQLSMWRAYGGKAGVAIVFTEKFFKDLQKIDRFMSEMEPHERLLNFGKVYYPKLDDKDTKDKEVITKNAIAKGIRALVPFVKHPAFREEKEYRLVIYFNFYIPVQKEGIQSLHMERISSYSINDLEEKTRNETIGKITERKKKIEKELKSYEFEISFSVEVIRGIPQEICKFHFSIKDHLDYLVIGPTPDHSHAKVIQKALAKKTDKTIHLSDIPLRQY